MENRNRMQIAIVGGTGFIGSALLKALEPISKIILFSRKLITRNNIPLQCIRYQSFSELSTHLSTLAVDGIINLSGHPVAGSRWTQSVKEAIYSSRIRTTRAIVEGILHHRHPPAFLINASAIGYYGDTGNRETDESGSPGDDFLATVCREWEKEALQAQSAGLRVVLFRFGMILGNGGALPKLVLPYRFFVGGPVGSGHQWISWIHIGDIVRIILEAIHNPSYRGPINCVSPCPVTMRQFAESLGQILHRPSWLRLPDWLLHFILGEAASVITASQKIIPAKLLEQNFSFRYPKLSDALSDILTQS